MAELVQEADDRALLADAAQGCAADPAALAACRAEAQALESFEPPLPER